MTLRALVIPAYSVGVKHPPWRFGRSKYGVKRSPKSFFDLLTVLFLTRYKKRPMHFFAGSGSLFAFTGGVLLAALTAGDVFGGRPLPKTPLGIAGGLCLLTGTLLAGLGLLGELLLATRND